MDNFLDLGLWNYVVLDDVTNVNTDDNIVDGLQRLYFDDSCSRSVPSIAMVIEGPDSKLHPHTFKFQFECTNIEVEYDALIQGLE